MNKKYFDIILRFMINNFYYYLNIDNENIANYVRVLILCICIVGTMLLRLLKILFLFSSINVLFKW